jgi:hypothetical protein
VAVPLWLQLVWLKDHQISAETSFSKDKLLDAGASRTDSYFFFRTPHQGYIWVEIIRMAYYAIWTRPQMTFDSLRDQSGPWKPCKGEMVGSDVVPSTARQSNFVSMG